MNKDRFSDRRLSQISSLKELQSTRRKISNRLDILEDKFEHTSVWSLLNFEGAMQNFVRKAASIREAWDSILEIVRSLRDRGEKCIETVKESVKARVRKGKAKAAEVAEKSATKALAAAEKVAKKAAEKVQPVVTEESDVPVVESAEVVETEVTETTAPKPRRRRSGRRKKSTATTEAAE